ncbi:MAG: hypothetical protein IIB06_02975 [Bacteroidetes bacterium]|nr:hypothetical protein [Bacteroidota bacterium]
MIYKVRAKYKKELAGNFFEKLTDGSISSQKPDGKEIVSSMKRAKIIKPGIIEWFEMCFCSSPLQHERETVYNLYLSDITTEIVDYYREVRGNSFWSYLSSAS